MCQPLRNKCYLIGSLGVARAQASSVSPRRDSSLSLSDFPESARHFCFSSFPRAVSQHYRISNSSRTILFVYLLCSGHAKILKGTYVIVVESKLSSPSQCRGSHRALKPERKIERKVRNLMEVERRGLRNPNHRPLRVRYLTSTSTPKWN
jgi:hypothetical protein